MQAKVSRLRFASSRWGVLSVAVVIAVVGGIRVVPWAAATTSSGDRAIFEPLPPVRILDTRTPSNPVGSGESRVLQVTGAGGVLADATAVVLNVTAVVPTAAGWLTLYPADAASVPVVSNVNFSTGQVVPNSVTVRLSVTGAVKIFNAAGQTHVIVDVAGYYRGHDHDDRYYVKAQTQARTAANSLTCPAGQFLSTVAADGTPTCGSLTGGAGGLQEFKATGTWMAPAGISHVSVEAWGGGGGGGARPSSCEIPAPGGGGGGSGGFVRTRLPVVAGESYEVSVGTGGAPGAAGTASRLGKLGQTPLMSAGGGASGEAALSGGAGGPGGTPSSTATGILRLGAPGAAGMPQSDFADCMGGVGGRALEGSVEREPSNSAGGGHGGVTDPTSGALEARPGAAGYVVLTW